MIGRRKFIEQAQKMQQGETPSKNANQSYSNTTTITTGAAGGVATELVKGFAHNNHY